MIYSKPLREYRKAKFKIEYRVCISKYDLPFGKGDKSQITQKVLEIVAFASKRPPTYAIKDDQDGIIRGKFNQKELNKLI